MTIDAPVKAALDAFLSSAEMEFERPETDASIYRLPMTGVHGDWDVFIQVREPQCQLLFYSLCPFRVEPAHRNATMELVTRINFGLVLGNFELDLGDGALRFKTALAGAPPSQEQITTALSSNVAMIDAYLPALGAVAEGHVTASEAFEALEAEAEDEDEPARAAAGDGTEEEDASS